MYAIYILCLRAVGCSHDFHHEPDYTLSFSSMLVKHRGKTNYRLVSEAYPFNVNQTLKGSDAADCPIFDVITLRN